MHVVQSLHLWLYIYTLYDLLVASVVVLSCHPDHTAHYYMFVHLSDSWCAR